MALHVLFDDAEGQTKQLVVPSKAVLIRIDEVGILQQTRHVDGYTEIRIQEPQGLAKPEPVGPAEAMAEETRALAETPEAETPDGAAPKN